MPVVLRSDDPIDPNDDVVIRAGGGSVEALVDKALETAEDYQKFVDQGLIRSPYAISVNVPRVGLASLDDLLGDVPFKRYKPYLEAPAAALLGLGWVDIVATTPVLEDGATLSRVDLTHYDVLVDAATEEELTERVTIVREPFERHKNPHHESTKPERKE